MNNQITDKSGCFLAHDKHEAPVLLEWHYTGILSPTLASFKSEVSDCAARITASTEVQFLRAHPEAVTTGGFFGGCEPLFAHGIDNIDWDNVEKTVQSTIQHFYLMDLSTFGSEIIDMLLHDVYFFVAVKDKKTHTLLGYMMTSITPALPAGDIKLINMIIEPEKQHLNLEKLLISSILKVMPQIKRIFTTVRSTDNTGLRALEDCKFVEDLHPVQDPHHPITRTHVIALEYKVDQSTLLQETTQMLIK